ncbi:hypothetical protein [Streptomyces sp. NPDC020747]|uniref:hypothetical protein n=1 Tax=Streptomyces sp. NPDC020747 TaxID=3365086 RepID=UPI0037AB700A
MIDLIARLLEPLLGFLFPAGGRRHRTGAHPRVRTRVACPYSCDYVGGPTGYHRGERPLRGEDSPVVRPYLLVHEWQTAPLRAEAGA